MTQNELLLKAREYTAEVTNQQRTKARIAAGVYDPKLVIRAVMHTITRMTLEQGCARGIEVVPDPRLLELRTAFAKEAGSQDKAMAFLSGEHDALILPILDLQS